MPLYQFECTKQCTTEKYEFIVPTYFEATEDSENYLKKSNNVCPKCNSDLRWVEFSGTRNIRINFSPL